jgi:ankyrin repeat protein
MLIEARCNVDHEDKDGWTPLFFAAHNGHVSVTKQLIEALCNVDAQKNGVSPLHCAAGKGHASVTHLLSHEPAD